MHIVPLGHARDHGTRTFDCKLEGSLEVHPESLAARSHAAVTKFIKIAISGATMEVFQCLSSANIAFDGINSLCI